MNIDTIIDRVEKFYKQATVPVFYASELKIEPSGMRPESFDIVYKQRAAKQTMRPVEIEVYPNEQPYLADGRHRLGVAKKLGDDSLNAIVRYYDNDGNVINTGSTKLIID